MIEGLQTRPNFHRFAIAESGELDFAAVQGEVVDAAREVVKHNKDVAAILLECSLLPPYSAVIQEAIGLPVFDYVTMINFVFSAVVQKRYQGFM